MTRVDVLRGEFGQRYFGEAHLGDQRRTRRLVQVAQRLLENPGGTLPERIGDPSELTGLYRLMDMPQVTHQPPRPRSQRLDGAGEAHLVTLACSTPFDGHDHWTMELLADQMVRLRYVPSVSRETVRRTLKKRNQALAQGGMEHPARTVGGVRLEDGGCSDGLSSALRSEKPGGGRR